MVKDKQFSGFSLLEASVTMLIVAVFVALCSNAFTKRHITYQESDGHGRYECYRNSSGIVQRYVEITVRVMLLVQLVFSDRQGMQNIFL